MLITIYNIVFYRESVFQHLNNQITNELSEPDPFVNWELSVLLKITQGNKHKSRGFVPLDTIFSPSAPID